MTVEPGSVDPAEEGNLETVVDDTLENEGVAVPPPLEDGPLETVPLSTSADVATSITEEESVFEEHD